MAEKAEKKPEAPAGGSAEKKEAKPAAGAAAAAAGGGLLSKTPVLLGGAMLIEAVVLFAGFKFLAGGGPKSANAADLTTETRVDDKGGKDGSASADKNKSVEINVVDFKATNKQSGRTFLYDVSIFVSVKADAADKVKGLIQDREALIKDRVRTIIAESDPDKLGGGSEPGLETLRRQVKYQLDEICGEGLIDEVLVPRCIPYRTDY